MTQNVGYGLKIIRDFDAYRVGSKIIVKNSGRVASDRAQWMVDQGFVQIDPTSGRVTITDKGRGMIGTDLNSRTKAKAETFITSHPKFFMFGDRLVAVDDPSAYISRYVADHYIDNGVLIPRGDGFYMRFQSEVVVSPDELEPVLEFLRCLRLTSVPT